MDERKHGDMVYMAKVVVKGLENQGLVREGKAIK